MKGEIQIIISLYIHFLRSVCSISMLASYCTCTAGSAYQWTWYGSKAALRLIVTAARNAINEP